MRVIQLLRSLAEQGNTVVFSIHQPRASIYALFDDITLLSGGRVAYSGPVSDLVPHFTALGYPCPSNINPAEYYVDLVSVDCSTPEAESESKGRIASIVVGFDSSVFTTAIRQAKQAQRLLLSSPTASSSSSSSFATRAVAIRRKGILGGIHSIVEKAGLLVKKVRILHGRAWRQVTRDKSLNIARFCSSLFSALLFGAIYFKLGKVSAIWKD